MTDKQIEAIQKLKRIDIKYFLSGMMEQSNYIVEKAEEVNNAIGIVLKLLEKQQKEIERLYKDNYRLDRENQLKFEKAVDTSDYVSKEVIRKKIKELKDNRPYLSKFDDWKEKEYTNEDINNMCVEVLEDLLGDE